MKLGTLLFLALAVPLCSCKEQSAAEKHAEACAAFQFAACGGDPTGTWQLDISCSNATSAGSGACADTTSTDVPDVQQTVALAADGTYSMTATMKGTSTFTMSKACLDSLSSGVMTAQDLCVGMTEAGGMSCTWSSDTCSCSMTLDEVFDETGTYSVSGTTITMLASGSQSPETTNFCVQGNVFTMSDSQLRARYTRP